VKLAFCFVLIARFHTVLLYVLFICWTGIPSASVWNRTVK
jgi:hypothetical protein